MLKKIYNLSGQPLKKLLNTSGQLYRELKMKDRLENMSNEEIFSLLAENGRLIKRPIAYDGKKATIGYREDEYKENWS